MSPSGGKKSWLRSGGVRRLRFNPQTLHPHYPMAKKPTAPIEEPVAAPPAEWELEQEPTTDPEHGDLTPEFARWYLNNKSAGDFMIKYGDRLDKLPADVVARLNEGRVA